MDQFQKRTFALLAATAVMLGATFQAQASPACKEAAQKSAAASLPAACFQDAAAGSPLLRLDGSACQPTDGAYFEKKVDADALAAGGQVSTLSKTNVAGCAALFVVARPAAGTGTGGAAARDTNIDAILVATDPVVVLTHSRTAAAARALNTNANPNAIGTGLPDVAAEAVQILGQIVVDRATQAGYRMVSEKVQAGLQCLTADGAPNPSTLFPSTCAAIVSIRVQDLTMARDVLLRALASDITRAAFGQLHPLTDAQIAAIMAEIGAVKGADASKVTAAARAAFGAVGMARAALLDLKLPAAKVNALLAATPLNDASKKVVDLALAQVIPSLLTTISDPTKKRAGVAAHAIAAELEAFARANAVLSVDERIIPLVLAGAALLTCEARVADGSLPNLAACDISKEVDAFTQTFTHKSERATAVGRAVARSLQGALTATTDGKADPDKRIMAGLAATFDATCFAVNPDASLGCPALLDIGPSDQAQTVMPLALARGMLEAALERDTNRMVTTAVRGIDVVLLPALAAADETKARKRAMRLLGGIVQYADTFQPGGTSADSGTQEARHEQRTKILESLTADMTERTGRDGDWIVSMGGSLAVVGGARLGGGKGVFNGPLSLSLGLGLQNVPETSPIGWHFEFGVLDLAQYLSLQSEPDSSDTAAGARKIVVREPKVQDALSPSFKLGFHWGREVPVYLAGAVGYAPFYQFVRDDGTKTASGAVTIGLALGGYVPLLDLN